MTTTEFRDKAIQALQSAGSIACRAMMGEYCLYLNGTLFGGLYDNRLLLKVTPSGQEYGLPSEIPYPGAKPMLYVSDLSDERLISLVQATTAYLAARKK